MSVTNINDHMALACECGSVNFSLLRSDGIECNKCGKRMPMEWREYDASRCPDCDGEGRRETGGYVDGSGYPHTYMECCDTCEGVGWCGPDAEKRAAIAKVTGSAS